MAERYRPPLVRYRAACRAVAEAKSVDEVASIRDQAEAVRLYARLAKKRDLEIDAAEIRLRAERRLGELLRAGERARGGQPYHADKNSTGSDGEQVDQDPRPTLEELGVSRKLSARAQRSAAIPT